MREVWEQSHHVVACEVTRLTALPTLVRESREGIPTAGSDEQGAWIAECRFIRVYKGPMRQSASGLAFRVRFEAPVAESPPKAATDPLPALPLRVGRRLVLFLRAPAGLNYLRDAPPPSGAPPEAAGGPYRLGSAFARGA